MFNWKPFNSDSDFDELKIRMNTIVMNLEIYYEEFYTPMTNKKK